MNTIGQKIKALREKAGLSQMHIAQFLGIDQSTISKCEKGERQFDFNERDELFTEAARLIVRNQIGSTSLIQRKLALGYARSGRLMDQLEAVGIVGPNLGSKAREVYIKTEEELERILQEFGE